MIDRSPQVVGKRIQARDRCWPSTVDHGCNTCRGLSLGNERETAMRRVGGEAGSGANTLLSPNNIAAYLATYRSNVRARTLHPELQVLVHMIHSKQLYDIHNNIYIYICSTMVFLNTRDSGW
jgi:hypothetical protein